MRTIKRVRRIARVCKTEKEQNYSQQGSHELLKPCTTRMGKHKIGELGVFLNQANGSGCFFPDRGGFTMIPVDSVRRVPIVPTQRIKKSVIAPTGKITSRRKIVKVAAPRKAIIKLTRRSR